MLYVVKDGRRYRMDSRDMMEALGFPSTGHIPEGAEGVYIIQGVRVEVRPSRGGSKHRIFAQCECGEMVPFGRLGQHSKGRAHALRCYLIRNNPWHNSGEIL